VRPPTWPSGVRPAGPVGARARWGRRRSLAALAAIGAAALAACSGSTPGPAAATCPAATPGSAPCPAAPASASADPARRAGPPDAGDTGVPGGVTLRRSPGDLTVSKPGTVISGLDVQGGIIVDADNVTIRDSRVRGIDSPYWGIRLMEGRVGLRVSRVEIGGGSDGRTFTGTEIGIILSQNDGGSADTNVVRQLNIHHTEDGIRLDGNASVLDSYVHDLQTAPGVHSDGSQTTGWSNIVLKGNYLEGGTNSPVFLNQEDGRAPIVHVLVEDNWLIAVRTPGGLSPYGVAPEGGVSDVSVIGNRFSPHFKVGPGKAGFSWTLWERNTYLSGAPVPRP
jgi:hypothetical protein